MYINPHKIYEFIDNHLPMASSIDEKTNFSMNHRPPKSLLFRRVCCGAVIEILQDLARHTAGASNV